jgi:hypothetical protein
MKTLLLFAFASLTSPLRIVKSIQERFKKANGMYVSWLNPRQPKAPVREMINNPRYWDSDWFKNYE